MRFAAALFLLAGSSFYLYGRYGATVTPEPELQAPQVVAQPEPVPFLSREELARVRKSVVDGDSTVRRASMETLYALKDPQIVAALAKVLAEDNDPTVRLRAVDLLRTLEGPQVLAALARGVRDVDPLIRVSSLQGIAKMGDSRASSCVVDALKDPEPEVRTQALAALGAIQEKRNADFGVLAEQLRRQYEAAARKTREQNVNQARANRSFL